MHKDIDYYMGLNYKIEIIEDKEEGGFVFSCPELKGCNTCAESILKGFELLEDAKKCWFTACIEDEIPIPEPSVTDVLDDFLESEPFTDDVYESILSARREDAEYTANHKRDCNKEFY